MEQIKIERAIKLIRLFAEGVDEPIEVAYSGGKDSDVILQLVRESGINYRAIYKNTTIDPPGTICHVRSMGVEIRNPKLSFFELIAKKGFPNRLHRFCCSELKEYPILKKCIIGIRREESNARSKRYQEPTACRFYNSKKIYSEHLYPILDWTKEDVKDYIESRNIKVASLYYDENGIFKEERRLGCMCCPQAYYKRRIKEFQEHPQIARSYIRAGKKFLNTHPDSVVATKYKDVYEWFYRDVFFKSEKDYQQWKSENPNVNDFKNLIENSMKINLK